MFGRSVPREHWRTTAPVVILLFLSFLIEQSNKIKETSLPQGMAVFGLLFAATKRTEQIGCTPNIFRGLARHYGLGVVLQAA